MMMMIMVMKVAIYDEEKRKDSGDEPRHFQGVIHEPKSLVIGCFMLAFQGYFLVRTNIKVRLFSDKFLIKVDKNNPFLGMNREL